MNCLRPPKHCLSCLSGCCLDTDLRKRYLGSDLVTCGRMPWNPIQGMDIGVCVFILCLCYPILWWGYPLTKDSYWLCGIKKFKKMDKASLSSGSKNNPNKKPAWSRQQSACCVLNAGSCLATICLLFYSCWFLACERSACCLLHAGLMFDWLFNLEEEECCLTCWTT
jgi:hypothetical protein